MDVNDQFHAAAALSPEKAPRYLPDSRPGWVLQPVWKRWRREKSVILSGIEPRITVTTLAELSRVLRLAFICTGRGGLFSSHFEVSDCLLIDYAPHFMTQHQLPIPCKVAVMRYSKMKGEVNCLKHQFSLHNISEFSSCLTGKK